VVGYQRGLADTQVDISAIKNILGNALGKFVLGALLILTHLKIL
jgi:hypothetical protein